jgi:hypothetical protein
MSVADMLAAARGQKAAAPPSEAAEPVSKSEPAEEAPGKSAATPKPAKGDLPTTVEEIVAYCRQADSK